MRRILACASILAIAAVAGPGCSREGEGGGRSRPTLTLRGGRGTGGAGGSGGYFDVQSHGGAGVRLGGPVEVVTGAIPPTVLPSLGANVHDVTSDAELAVRESGARLTAGSRAVRNGAGVVTGLRVRPGVTLTVRPNWDADDADGDGDGATGTREEARIELEGGLLVEGRLVVGRCDGALAGDGEGAATASLRIAAPEDSARSVGRVDVAPDGVIDLSGADGGAGAGGDAGALLASPVAFDLRGTILTQGGAGATGGGQGGAVEIETTVGDLVAAGSIAADGGAASGGIGGVAGGIALRSEGALIVRGILSSIGGVGGAGGGYGSRLHLHAEGGGADLDGLLRAHGGDATVDGHGGGGDYVDLRAAGKVRWAGIVDTHGGDGVGSGIGGSGGHLDVVRGGEEGDGAAAPAGSGILFGASVDTSGGSGTVGGSAGAICVYDESLPGVPGEAIRLVGHGEVDLSGGDGSTEGGAAGGAGERNHLACWSGAAGGAGGCTVHNAANFTMRGGAGSVGGSGAGLHLEAEASADAPYGHRVTNHGVLEGSGGDGSMDGGDAGTFRLCGRRFVDQTGAIVARGGDAGSGRGGGGGDGIELCSGGGLRSSGTLDVRGGASSGGAAGDGGSVRVQAVTTASIRGAVTADGGTSRFGAGGAGGYVWILCESSVTEVGGVSASGGAGALGAGADGEIWLDGVCVEAP